MFHFVFFEYFAWVTWGARLASILFYFQALSTKLLFGIYRANFCFSTAFPKFHSGLIFSIRGAYENNFLFAVFYPTQKFLGHFLFFFVPREKKFFLFLQPPSYFLKIQGRSNKPISNKIEKGKPSFSPVNRHRFLF